MAATIRGTFELIDRASDTLKKIEQQALKTQTAVEGVGTALDKQQGGGAARSLEADADALNKVEDGAKDARKAIDDLTSSHGRLSSSTSSSTRSMSAWAAGLQTARNMAKGLASDVGTLMDRMAKPFTGNENSVTGGLSGIKTWTSDLRSFLSQKSSVTQMKAAVKDLGEAFGTFGTAFKIIQFTGIASAIQPAIASIDALGGALVALLPELARAAGAIDAFPAGMSVLAQAMGVMKLATSGVGSALSQLQQSQSSYGQSQQQFAQQMQSANNAVISANQGLTAALYSQNQAQVELNATRIQATRTLQDMEFAARTSVLQEASAGLNIQQAQQELQQAMMTPGTTQLQLEQDRLAVYQAQADAQQTHTQALRDRQDYAAAKRGDADSAPVMQLAQAQHAVVTSSQDVTNAQRAQRQAQQALNQTQRNGSSATQQYKKALDTLQPAQRAFVKFLQGSGAMRDLHRLQNAAAAGLFPGVEPGITRLLSVMPQLDAVAERTGRVMGDAFSSVLKVFSDPKWITNVGDKNVSILKGIGDGFHSIAEIIKEVIPPGQQFVAWLVRLGDEWLRAKAQQDAGAAGFDRLTRKFHQAEAAIKTIFNVGRNLWDTFKGITRASNDLGNALWGGMQKGTKGWAEWANSQRGQNSMRKYFDGLLPTLRALGKLVDSLSKAFIQLGNGGGQSEATGFIDRLNKLVPDIEQILRGTGQWSAALSPALNVFGKIMAVVSSISGTLLKIKPLSETLGLALAFATITRFTSKLSSAGTILGNLSREFSRRRRGGLDSPGVTSGEGGSNPLSRVFGSGAKAIQLSALWGMRSSDGPGSLANPFAVVVTEGGSIGGGDNPLGGAEKKAEQEGSDVNVKRMEGGEGIVRDAEEAGGAAEDAGRFGKIAGFGSKIAGFAGDAAEFAGPIGMGLAALPSLVTLLTTRGSIGKRLSAAGNQAISTATFGLVNTAAPTFAHQQQQGRTGADRFFTGLQSNSAGGLSASAMAAYQQRLADLQRRYNLAANGRTVQVGGRYGDPAYTLNEGKNNAVRQETYASLMRMKTNLATDETSAGKTDAEKWQQDFADAINSGQKPQQAMRTLESGLSDTLNQLTPDGKKALDTSMASWANEFAINNPKLQGQVDGLNDYITNSFQTMGQNVQIVNGQILTGSQTQWGQIETALTNPMAVAQEKLTGAFKTIQQEAVGALQAMGLSKSDAQTLLKNPASANQWEKYYQHGSTGVAAKGTSHASNRAGGARAAGGGRVHGGDLRDVYNYGGNMLGGGELVMNRHQEMDANARLMRHGEPTVGSIVSGMNKPHWMATGGRTIRAPQIPGSGVGQILAQSAVNTDSELVAMILKHVMRAGGGGAVGGGSVPVTGLSGTVSRQVWQFMSANGFNRTAVAGMLGNALQESSMNPNTPGGGLWQQISNFGSGSGGSLLNQMQTMLPQILSLRTAMNAASSPAAAAALFMSDFERPAVATENLAHRQAGAEAAYSSGFARGGRVANAGWFRNGGQFTTSGPTIFGAGEGGQSETVTVRPAGSDDRPIQITIHHIEVNRKGDIKKVIDEEFQILANSLRER